MKMAKLSFYIITLFISLIGVSQTVEVKSYVDKNRVVVNEVFTFEITTNANCRIQRPNFNGLQVIQGPFQSNASRMVNINGQRAMEREFKITYRLRAQKPGNYIIDPVHLECNDKAYDTKKITIKVSEAPTGSQTIPANANADFFIRMHASKKEVYQGEPFTLSLKMYSKNQPQNLDNIEFGDSEGIWRKDLNPKQTNFTSDIEVVNGMRYFTTTIHSELCFAQTDGEVSIEPGYVSAIFRRGFFNTFRREAHSNAVKIKVNPLPQPAPKHFNGLVGSFTLKHEISKTSLKPGEAIDLTIKISGRGNMNTFDDPVLGIPNDFEQFDPEINNNLSYKSSGISGSIAYNYVLVPTFYGDYNIPAYTFSYFDLDSESYKTLSTGDFNIHVQKTENSTARPTGEQDNKKAVDIQNEDIHYLIHDADQNLFRYDDFLVSKFIYIILILLPFMAMGGIYLFRLKQGTVSHQTALANKTLKKQIEKEMAAAKAHSNDNDDKAALGVINNVLRTFTQQKLKLKKADMSLPTVIEHLEKEGISTDLSTQYSSIWQTIEMYQYAPITAEKIDDLIGHTEHLIYELDKVL